MGFFGDVRKIKKEADWKINKQPTIITMEEKRIHCKSAVKEFNIFYADIRNIEKQFYSIKIETNVEEYTLIPKKLRGATALADELYSEIVERMNENK